MKLYRVIRDRKVEAHNAEEAESIHMENNSYTSTTSYYYESDGAYDLFHIYEDDLYHPKKLGNGLYWFDCVSVEWADGCDEPQDDEEIADCFCNGSEFGVDMIAVGKYEDESNA